MRRIKRRPIHTFNPDHGVRMNDEWEEIEDENLPTFVPTDDGSIKTSDDFYPPNSVSVDIFETFQKLFNEKDFNGVNALINYINDLERRNGHKLSHPFDYLIFPPHNPDGVTHICIIGVDNHNRLCLTNERQIIPYSYWKQIEKIGIVDENYRTTAFNVDFRNTQYVYSTEPKISTTFNFINAIDEVNKRHLMEYEQLMNKHR